MENQKSIKIKKNSLFVRLHEFVYSKSAPGGLCPLFWQGLPALILFIPLLIFNIPSIIINLTDTYGEHSEDKSFNGFMETWKRDVDFWPKLGVSLILWIVLFVAYVIVAGWYFMLAGKTEGHDSIVSVSAFITLAAICVGLWQLYKYIRDKIGGSVSSRRYKKRQAKYEAALEAFIQANSKLIEGKSFDYPDDELDFWEKKFNEHKQKLLEEQPDPWIFLFFESIKAFYNKNCPRIEWI